MAKNMRVKGTNFEDLGFGFELPQSLMGTVGAVRVMRVEYDHYSKMCRSNKIPPRFLKLRISKADFFVAISETNWRLNFRAEKDIPSYIDLVDDRLKSLSDKIADQLEEQRLQQELMEAQQRAAEEAERERLRMVKLERKTKAAAAAAGPKGQGRLEKNDFSTTTSLVLKNA